MPLTDMPDDPVDDRLPDEQTEEPVETEAPEEPVDSEQEPVDSDEQKEQAAKDDEPALGKRVQKRIDKLTRNWRTAQEQIEAERARNAELEARLAKLEESSHKARASDETAELDRKIAEARARRKQALEDADPEAEDTATDELLDLRLKKAQLQQQPQKPSAQTPQPPGGPAKPQPPIPKAERDWQARNTWFADPGEQAAAATAGALYQTLLQESRQGLIEHDPDDPEFYEELDRRLGAAIPRLAKKPGKNTEPSRLPVGAGSRGVGSRPSKNATRLTTGDIDSMRKYHMDPDKKLDREAWLRAKRGEL